MIKILFKINFLIKTKQKIFKNCQKMLGNLRKKYENIFKVGLKKNMKFFQIIKIYNIINKIYFILIFYYIKWFFNVIDIFLNFKLNF